MKALIVDDEERSHIALEAVLKQHHPELELVAHGYDVEQGIELIGKHQPELLFLDIEMPDGTGFDLLSRIAKPQFHLIFVTAFNQYAQTAIRFGALDYLTKPVVAAELSNAILKARVKQIERIQLEQLEIIQETLRKLEQRQLPKRMGIATSKGVLFFPTNDIIRLEAMDNFTEFKLQDDHRRLIASHHLKKFELDLSPYLNFMRIHRSYLINLLHVKRLIKGERWFVEMTDGGMIPVAKRCRLTIEKGLGTL